MKRLCTGHERGLPGHGASENAVRHGPVDPIRVHRPGPCDGPPPVKKCPKCHMLILTDCGHCPNCGFVFLGYAAHDDPASGVAALPIQARQLLSTRRRSAAIAGGPMRPRRHPSRAQAASAILSYCIGLLGRYQSKSRSA
jgi:hypothetical protein